MADPVFSVFFSESEKKKFQIPNVKNGLTGSIPVLLQVPVPGVVVYLLEVGVRSKKQTYAYAATQGKKVTPLLLSTGGTLHKTTYHFLEKIIPDSSQRRWLQTDIAIILARARAQIYACNIEYPDLALTQI